MTVNTTTLTIASTKINQDAEGRYRLNDCHRAAGGEHTKRPSIWMATQQTQELIAEIAENSQSQNSGFDGKLPISTVKGGNASGTYACKELVYAYAMWINPKFHLAVIRAFDALVQEKAFSLPQTLPEALRLAADLSEENTRLLPKADAFDELANMEGLHTLRESAKLCGWPEKLFIRKLVESPISWLYVHSSSGRKHAYAKPIKEGLMCVKEVTIFHKTTGRETYGQPMITQKGLTKIATKLGKYNANKEASYA